MYQFLLSFPWLLLALSVLLQCFALASPVDRATYPTVIGSLEMLLVAGLWLNVVLLYRCLNAITASGHVLRTARFCVASLSLCICGDWLNRNFPQQFFLYDAEIEHSYLIDSVWFFLPGYGLFLIGVYRLVVNRVSWRWSYGLSAIAAVSGALSFLLMVKPGISVYTLVLTASYAVVIALMGAAAILLIRAYSWPAMRTVAGGCVLALLADVLIGNFWLYGEGYYPQVAHTNWIVYFASQVMVQRLPHSLDAFNKSAV